MNICAHLTNEKMRQVVLDTNCLLMSLPKTSPYRIVWNHFLAGTYVLCVSNEILEEYQEVLAIKTTPSIASNVISTILNCPNIRLITPYYRFGLISSDADDNKFVDCAITSGADYIVTNDAHFDVLEHIPFPKVSTLPIKDFSEELYTSNTSGVSSTLLNEERIPYTTKKALK